jgi:dolichyl-phosphate-mannose-protein mannosyltransferase
LQDATTKLSFYKRFKLELLALGGYLVLTCIYAHRVLANFGSHIAGHGGDGWQNIWNMWWFKHALASWQSPYFTDMLHHPSGTTLLFHTLNPFNCALSLPFDLVFGQPVAYNIVFLFSFVASGFTMYLLVKELYANRAAAFIAGCIFTFSHFHFAHAQGHLQLTAMEWLPLFLYYLVRVWRRRRLRDGILMGVSLTLTTFCAIYYFMAGLLVAFLAGLYMLIRDRKRVLEKKLLLVIGSGALVFLATGGVLLIAMLINYFRLEMLPAHDSVYWSTDLQAFFIPPWVSAYGGAFESIWSKWTGNSSECNQYLGYTVIALGVMAFVLMKKGSRPWAWAGLMLIGMLLSLGPVLHWGGKTYTNIPLPYGLFEFIFPFLKMSGAPVRWHIITLLASSILAGAGLSVILARVKERKLGKLSLAFVTAILCGIITMLELLPHWVESRELLYNDFIEEMRATPEDWVVYDLGDANYSLLRQTGHRHKMIGGYVSRSTRPAEDFLKKTPLLRALRGQTRWKPERIRQAAAEFGLKFVILPYNHRARRSLGVQGLNLRWSQWGLEVWEIPAPAAADTQGAEK